MGYLSTRSRGAKGLLFLLLLFPLGALALPENKPALVVISYGRLRNPVTRDWDTGVQLEMFLGTLRGCGIEPITLDDVPLSKLTGALKAKSIPPGAIVLLNAHGFVASDGTYEVGSPVSSAGWMSGDALVDIVVKTLASPRIWLGTCHSGACKVHSPCLGAECLASQTSSVNLDAFHVISELVCDGYQGDCSLWRKADQDGDGTLSSSELDAYLADHGDGWRQMPATASGTDRRSFELVRETLRMECHDLKGVLSPKSEEEAEWELRFEQGGKTLHALKEIPSSLPDAASVEHFLASRYPDFPRSCGDAGSPSPRRNCSFALLGISQRLECDADKAPMASAGDDFDSLDDYYLPRVGTFSLESKHCAKPSARN